MSTAEKEVLIMETTQHLTFNLDDELFAVNIAQTLEVLEYIKITKVPRTPEFMVGVINLRGSVIPVIDLRLKFGMKQNARSVNTCIVIAEIAVEKEKTVLGIVVDSVQEVFEIEEDKIEAAPKIGTQLNVDFIKGMGKKNEEFIIILDIDKVFSANELALVTQSSSLNVPCEASEAGEDQKQQEAV